MVRVKAVRVERGFAMRHAGDRVGTVLFAAPAIAAMLAVLVFAASVVQPAGASASEPGGVPGAPAAGEPLAATDLAAVGPLDLSRLFADTAPAEGGNPAAVEALAFDSSGSTIYGQIMVPAASYGDGRPCVVMFHGFAGFTRMDDVAQALCRAGCVVVVLHHRGAWGSEGTYSFSNCIEDAVNLVEYVRSDGFCGAYGVDPDSIVLFGHSMGGNTALNAAARLDCVRAVVLVAPCDIAALYQTLGDDELRTFLVDNGSEVLRTDGLDSLIEDVAGNADDWLFPNAAEEVEDVAVLVAAGELDTVCPAGQMVDPLMEALGSQDSSELRERRDYDADHSLAAARVRLTCDVAAFIDEACG